MEDILKFLAIAGIIIIGFVRQAKKEAKKKADSKPFAPMPDEANPFPQVQGDETYGGYIPKGPQPETVAIPANTEKPKTSSQSFIPKSTISKSSNRADTLSKQRISPPEAIIQENEEPSEFEIHSTEEARRAIVWSEILQRKY